MRRRTVSDYLAMLRGLMPRGAAWRGEAGTVLAAMLEASAEELVRLDGAARLLMDESNPRTAVDALADWERTLGLPDECGGLRKIKQHRYGTVLVTRYQKDWDE